MHKDIIEIKGKRKTVAKCLPLYPSDEGRGVIRVDGLIRNNAGVAISDTISIRRINAPNAEKVYFISNETSGGHAIVIKAGSVRNGEGSLFSQRFG